MKVALDTAQCPLDANLESILPGVHLRLHANEAATQQVSIKVDGLGELVSNGFKNLQDTLLKSQQAQRQQLAGTFFNIASQLSGGPAALILRPGDKELERTSGESVPTLGANTDVPIAIEDASQVTDLNSNESSRYNLPADPKAVPKTFMKTRHDTLSDLWDEWHGLGEYKDISGGFAGRELVWGSTKGIIAK